MTERWMETVDVYLGLGTNLGDRESNLRQALESLDDAFGTRCSALSDFHETEPWGFESNERFLNAVVRYTLPVPHGTSRPVYARNVLDICKSIERSMGRTGFPEYGPDGKRIYHSRLIDIDILLIGDWHINEQDLIIPHPLMKERDFVMIPLSEIISDNMKSVFKEIFG